MRGDTDPDAEDGQDLEQPFARVVAPLADGNLTHSAPFDISTSAALADNLDTGDIAERLFEVTAQRQSAFRISITALAPDHPELPEREVLNTQVQSLQTLTVILEDLLDELHDRLPQD